MTFDDLWSVVKAAASGWVEDYAQSMGAALAYYTMFSIAPLLLIVISIAGLLFGDEAARGEIFSQLEGMLGVPGALAVQAAIKLGSLAWRGAGSSSCVFSYIAVALVNLHL